MLSCYNIYMTKGKFIVIEGLDGSGTTTQCRMLAETLARFDVPIWLTAEPVNDSPTGKRIRSILRGDEKVSPETLAELFAEDRREHLYGKNGIVDHLKHGHTVICDRYKFSSIAYQSVSCDPKMVRNLNRYFPNPDYLFYLQTPVDVCLQRIADRNGTPEIFEKKEYLEAVGDIYWNYFYSHKASRICTQFCAGSTPAARVAYYILLAVVSCSREIFPYYRLDELKSFMEEKSDEVYKIGLTL